MWKGEIVENLGVIGSFSADNSQIFDLPSFSPIKGEKRGAGGI
jgi:hypothetical protein